MALTEQDLQEISTLLDPLQNDIQDMKVDMQNMKVDMQNMKVDMQDMKVDMQDMKVDMQDMKVDMQDMKVDMQDMKLDIQDMSKRITSLEVHIENETDRNIQRLAENHLDMIRKLNEAVDAHTKDLIFEIEISSLKSRVTRLEEKRT